MLKSPVGILYYGNFGAFSDPKLGRRGARDSGAIAKLLAANIRNDLYVYALLTIHPARPKSSALRQLDLDDVVVSHLSSTRSLFLCDDHRPKSV